MNWKSILKEDRPAFMKDDIIFKILKVSFETNTEDSLIAAIIERDELRLGIEQSVMGKIIKLLRENKIPFLKPYYGLEIEEYEITIIHSKDHEEKGAKYENLDELLTKIEKILKSSKQVKSVFKGPNYEII